MTWAPRTGLGTPSLRQRVSWWLEDQIAREGEAVHRWLARYWLGWWLWLARRGERR